MIDPRQGWGIPRTYASLYRARRVLNEQALRPPWGSASFNDNLPWVFDCILDVRRALHMETVEMRSRAPDHETWWVAILQDQNFKNLKDVRNEEVKGWGRVTAEHIATQNGVHVQQITVRAPDEWDRVEVYSTDYVETLPPLARIRHEFTIPAWADRPVLPLMKQLLDRLELEVLPRAAEFSARWGPEGKALPRMGPSEVREDPAFSEDAWCLVLEAEAPGQIRWAYTLTPPGELGQG